MDLNALRKISYGMFVIGAKNGGKLNGQIANTVFQVSAEPPTLAVAINKQNLTHEFITAGKFFSVSVLSVEAPMKYIGLFGFKSGRETDKYAQVKFKPGITGCPVATEYSIAYYETEVIGSCDAGTHTIFLGRLVASEILEEKEPMTYAYYHKVKGGLSPKAAPTYIKS